MSSVTLAVECTYTSDIPDAISFALANAIKNICDIHKKSGSTDDFKIVEIFDDGIKNLIYITFENDDDALKIIENAGRANSEYMFVDSDLPYNDYVHWLV